MSRNFEELKNNYNNTTIPEDMDNKINETLKSLPKKQGNRVGIKKAASIALIITTSLAVFALSFEEVRASIKSIFNVFQESGSYRELNSEGLEYSESTKNTTENNGLKINIDEVVYTPNGITYAFSLDKDFFKGDNEDDIEKKLSYYFGKGLPVDKVLINNNEVTPKLISGYTRLDNIGDKIIGFQNIVLENLQDKDSILLKLKTMGEGKKPWEINLTTNMKIANENIFKLESPIEKRNEKGAIAIEECISTPMFTYVVYTLEKGDEYVDLYNLTADITNENNRDMNRDQSNCEIREELGNNKVRIRNLLENYNSKVEKIDFTPMLSKNSKKSSNGSSNYEFIPLNTQVPFTLDLGGLGILRINSIEEKNNKVYINCDVTGTNKDRLLNSISIADKKTEKALKDPNIIGGFNPNYMDKESYENLNNLSVIENITISFDKEKGIDYSLIYSKSKESIYMNDIEIQLNLKNNK